MNLGLEVALARKWTLDIPVNYNPWKFDDTRLKHWGIQPSFATGSAKASTVRSSGYTDIMPTSMWVDGPTGRLSVITCRTCAIRDIFMEAVFR